MQLERVHQQHGADPSTRERPTPEGRAAGPGRLLLPVRQQIGPNVQLLTPTHPTEPEPRRAKWEAAQPITIGDNV